MDGLLVVHELPKERPPVLEVDQHRQCSELATEENIASRRRILGLSCTIACGLVSSKWAELNIPIRKGTHIAVVTHSSYGLPVTMGPL
jgi:hypothetical protein